MSEILMAVVTAFLIPVLNTMWSRRHKTHPEAAESLVFGLLIVAAAIASFYFAMSLPFEIENDLLDLLLVLFKILLFMVGVYGGIIGSVITWDSFKGFSEGTKGG